MFDLLSPVPDDPLLKLIGAFRSDNRANKIDLGVGVYRDNTGATPVMSVVKRAEKVLHELQDSKAYLGLAGDVEFLRLLKHQVFQGSALDIDQIASIQTPGGSGALRLAGDLVCSTAKAPRVWVGLPCWANHIPIFQAAGLKVETYAAYDPESHRVDGESMLESLTRAQPGDLVLLQGCCHNPTGGDMSDETWRALADLCCKSGLIPLIDIAYQGLGRGLREDMSGVDILLGQVPEAIVAVSCSKNFGLYRERTGALFVVAESPRHADIVRSNLFALARTSYSMPPDHGAALVRVILSNEELTTTWEAELSAMRARILTMRQGVVDCWQENPCADLSYLSTDRGMFSLLPLNGAQITDLRESHAIYVAGNGRINLAGLKSSDIPHLVASLQSVMS
jgi:aromatic-amino-acid transaminase